MSFQNYDSFQNQPGQQEAGSAGPGGQQQQDTAMGGPMPENAGQQFQGGNGGDPGSAGGPQGGDAKTTLWYVMPTTLPTSRSFGSANYVQRSTVLGDVLFYTQVPDQLLRTNPTCIDHMLIEARYRMGELEPWIDETFVRSVWYNMGEQVNVKMIRDKFSG